MINWKNDKNGVQFTKHSNFRIESVAHQSFNEMVAIVKGPAFGSHLLGKRFINFAKAINAIDIVCGEKLIGKGAKEAKEELMAMGLEVEE